MSVVTETEPNALLICFQQQKNTVLICFYITFFGKKIKISTVHKLNLNLECGKTLHLFVHLNKTRALLPDEKHNNKLNTMFYHVT